ncbi:hypothetical protein [Nostoc sp.]
MKPETRDALLQAYFGLQRVVFDLYADASFLSSRADNYMKR